MKSSGEHKTFALPNMRTLMKCFVLTGLRRYSRIAKEGGLVVALALSLPVVTSAADTGETFATPEEAVSALVRAATAESGAGLRSIFGPAAAELENPDRVQATNEFNAFNSAPPRSAADGSYEVALDRLFGTPVFSPRTVDIA